MSRGDPCSRSTEEDANTVETKNGKVRRLCSGWSSVILTAILVILFVGAMFAVLNYVLPCDNALEVHLEGFTVRDMDVVRRNSILWEVTSDIDLSLVLRNPNSWVRPCDFSLLKVEVSVYYRDLDSLISDFDFDEEVRGLEHASSHTVATLLTGAGSHVSDEAGVALEAQLLRKENVKFVLDINAKYIDARWTRMVNHKICEVVATTLQPQASMSSGDRGFVSAECQENVTEEV